MTVEISGPNRTSVFTPSKAEGISREGVRRKKKPEEEENHYRKPSSRDGMTSALTN